MLLAHFPKDEYWGRLDLTARLGEVDVPVMQWSGWYDQFLSETIAHWRDMSTRRAAEGDQYLVLGATDHMLSLELNGRIGQLPVAGHGHGHDRICRFFDRHLRGAETEFPSAPVTYFTLGREEWRTATEWPPPHVRAFELFAAATGGGQRRRTGRRLRLLRRAAARRPRRSPTPTTPSTRWTPGWAPTAGRRRATCATARPSRAARTCSPSTRRRWPRTSRSPARSR